MLPRNVAWRRCSADNECRHSFRRALLWLRRHSLRIETIDQRVLNFVRVAENVAIIETQYLGEVFHPGHVRVVYAWLDYVFPLPAQEFSIEYAIKCRRARFERRLQRLPIDGLGQCGPHIRERDSARRYQLLRINCVARGNLRTKAPALRQQRQRERRAQIETANQGRRSERGFTA